jgi:uncharacterized membrane protein
MNKNFLANSALIISFIIILFSQACDDTVGPGILPEENVSFNEHLLQVFQLKCNTAGCHNSQYKAGGISLETCAETTESPLVVFPYEPDNSSLIWAIEGKSGASQMPPLGSQPLTENERKAIRAWVKEGAKCN